MTTTMLDPQNDTCVTFDDGTTTIKPVSTRYDPAPQRLVCQCTADGRLASTWQVGPNEVAQLALSAIVYLGGAPGEDAMNWNAVAVSFDNPLDASRFSTLSRS
jgi:hypothetical protein